jgi:hypothetical protein
MKREMRNIYKILAEEYISKIKERALFAVPSVQRRKKKQITTDPGECPTAASCEYGTKCSLSVTSQECFAA